MKSDEELKKSFKIYLDQDNIINLVILEEQTDSENNTRQTELIMQFSGELLKNQSAKNLKMLVDLSPMGNASYMSSRSREIYSKSKIFKDLLKVAVVSPSLILKIMTYTISIATGKSDSVKWFDNKKEALNWLKE